MQQLARCGLLISNYQKSNFYIILIFIFILILNIIFASTLVLSLPPLPTEFYGKVRDYNYNGSVGEVIRAYDSSGLLCGSFTIVNEGYYGSLTCRGDDPETVADEGATAGENIIFRYKGSFTTLRGNNTWGYGVFQYVNITYPVVYCGDYFCDAWYEDYYSCPQDCPFYNGSINYTFNYTNVTPGGGAGEGGAGGRQEGGGLLGFIPQFYFNYTGLNETEIGLGFICKEEWECGNWSICRIDGFQNRTCIDKNNCGTFEDKPPEVQKCIYTPTCFDGVKNGLEEGIDCGGLCAPCITCFDSIQNCHDGACEEGIDCGGPCPPCPTCFDGKQNCHDGSCEEGIDCGGPCERKCLGIQIPIPGFECKKDFNPLSNQSIFFFIIILIIILINIYYSLKKIKDIEKKKKLSDIHRAKAILSVRRRMYLFIFITLLISLILYLYYYFFIMCEVEYRFLWLLLILLFISPLIIHELIRFLEFTEKKRLKKLEEVLNTHYKQIENLIRLENENLIELEEELADELYRLLEKPEYKAKENSEEMKLLKDVYKELVFLYSRYKERENPIEKEKILCDDIYKLLEDKRYAELVQKDIRLTRIISKLKLLYKQYEEKQKLYDEMGKIEESKDELEHELKEDKEKEDSDKEKEDSKDKDDKGETEEVEEDSNKDKEEVKEEVEE